MKAKEIKNLESLAKEVQDIENQLGSLPPEEIAQLLWEEAKFLRKEDPCTSWVLRLGKIKLAEIVQKLVDDIYEKKIQPPILMTQQGQTGGTRETNSMMEWLSLMKKIR